MKLEKFTNFQKAFDAISLTIISEILVGSFSFYILNFEFPSWFIFLLTASFILNSTEIYKSYRSKSLFLLFKRILIGWILTILIITLFIFLANGKIIYLKLKFIYWTIFCLISLFVNHIISRKLVRLTRERGENFKKILFWGNNNSAKKFSKYLDENPWIGFKIVKWFSPNAEDYKKKINKSIYCSGNFKNMKIWLKENKVSRIFFSDLNNNFEVLKVFGDSSIPISYIPEWAENTMRLSTDNIGNQNIINLWGINYSPLDLTIKSFFDFIFALLGVIFLSPIFILVSICIYIESGGPLFFLQERSGVNGKTFKIIKFRTMKVLESGTKPGLRQTTKNDSRLTKIGKILREWSIDELPQLFNVLAGEMSIVGPRPHAITHNNIYRKEILGYMQRHAMKPGITGLAQVSGFRGETKTIQQMKKRIEADLNYQSDWNLYLDLKILIKTILNFKSKEAY